MVREGTEGAVVCWGEVLWDLFPDGPRLGGAPANVAYHLAQLGRDVAMISRVGDDDLGRRAVAAMKRSGIGVEAVQTDPERPTGRVEVTLQGSEPSYDLVEGCAWEAIELDPSGASSLKGAAALCYGTLSQRTRAARESAARALRSAPPGCLRVCDPNLRPKHVDDELLRDALGHADIVKLNETEAAILSRRFGTADPIRWLLDELGVKLVAVTRGERGCLLQSREERAEHPGASAEAGGDHVGAGDAFTAVLIHLVLRDAPIEAIGSTANGYAAFVASCQGGTPKVPAAVLERLGLSG